jgi:hypothetical protein
MWKVTFMAGRAPVAIPCRFIPDTTPARPPAAQSDRKQSIEGRKNGSLTFSLQGGELQPQGDIFDGDGLVTAQQESDVSKGRQEKGWHVLRLFVRNPFQVNLLRAGPIMANDRCT